MATFKVSTYWGNEDEHEIGNLNCPAEWCGTNAEYPKPCKCGGLIHADFGDEDWDGNYWVYTKCDLCGCDEWGEKL